MWPLEKKNYKSTICSGICGCTQSTPVRGRSVLALIDQYRSDSIRVFVDTAVPEDHVRPNESMDDGMTCLSCAMMVVCCLLQDGQYDGLTEARSLASDDQHGITSFSDSGASLFPHPYFFFFFAASPQVQKSPRYSSMSTPLDRSPWDLWCFQTRLPGSMNPSSTEFSPIVTRTEWICSDP